MMFPCRQLWVLCLLLAVGSAWGEEMPVLTRISEVRNLSRDTEKKMIPVSVRGVVTWSGGTNWFIVQDDTGGTTVNVGLARRSKIWAGEDSVAGKLSVGDEVQIDGVAHAAGFAPIIWPKTLRVFGKKPLPEARPMTPARFFSGADAGERIEVTGVVQGYELPGNDEVILQVDANPGQFTVEANKSLLKNPKALVDAEVRFRGVAGTFFNSRGEVVGARLLVSQAGDLQIARPASKSPFASPPLALNQLFPFRPDPLGPHRQLAEGTVIYTQSGQVFYIQDGNTSVRVQTLSPQTLVPGDRVQVAGFVDMQRQVAGLSGALIRKVGTASLPEPVAITPGAILELNAQAMLHGLAPEPNDYDGRLITFRGRLINAQSAVNFKPPWHRLVLDVSGTVVEALLYKSDVQAFKELQTGSELQVSGIVQLIFDVSPQRQHLFQNPPVGLQIFMRDAQDVVVLATPPWWTQQRLMTAGVIGLVSLIGVMLWSWQLKRQLARKTTQLAAEMHARRDAAIEFKATLRERNRLAVNLHDTLLQTMSGLHYQLEACESESLPQPERKANHLETARQMVQHAQEDLRGTVWALRVLPLHERTFAEALRVLANQLSEGRGVKISINTEGELPLLSEFVAGNLLLVAQEAMHNALKHARPSRIVVTVSASPDNNHVVVEVKDDGTGFDLAASGKSPGHFGLAGMRERVERLGGKLIVESKSGQGTSVRAEITLRSFDEELGNP